jgi:hypothetical protein
MRQSQRRAWPSHASRWVPSYVGHLYNNNITAVTFLYQIDDRLFKTETSGYFRCASYVIYTLLVILQVNNVCVDGRIVLY